MTRRRAAAYGHRAFNAGFPAMNPIGRPSQPDPFRSAAKFRLSDRLDRTMRHSMLRPTNTQGSRRRHSTVASDAAISKRPNGGFLTDQLGAADLG